MSKNEKNPVLTEHFERLKELIPEVYSQPLVQDETETEKLYTMLKHSLGIIEAVYLQNREMFNAARVEEYGKILHQLKEMGYAYRGNEELLEKAAGQVIMRSKMPMKKAGTSSKDQENREAI